MKCLSNGLYYSVNMIKCIFQGGGGVRGEITDSTITCTILEWDENTLNIHDFDHVN